MMQNEWWRRPALLKSEAVLLPALPRPSTTRFSDRFTHVKPASEAFMPVTDSWPVAQPSTQLSTYVRSRGSMAGRSVLRAVGVRANRYMTRPVRRWR